MPVVRDLSLTIQSGHTVGIVGKTGSGKSSIGLAIMRLLPPGARTSGRIMLDDENLLSCPESRLRQIRGGHFRPATRTASEWMVMTGNGTLMLLRHGESEWHTQDRFTGWTDVPLSAAGRQQARYAGRLLIGDQRPSAVYMSELSRAIETVDIIMANARSASVMTHCAAQLNERDYGELEGWRRSEARRVLGLKRYDAIHRGWNTPPPTNLSASCEITQARSFYMRLTPRPDTLGETLADVSRRVLIYWSTVLRPQLIQGETILVVAHSNSLRALVKHLRNVPTDAVGRINVEVGQPMFFGADTFTNWELRQSSDSGIL